MPNAKAVYSSCAIPLKARPIFAPVTKKTKAIQSEVFANADNYQTLKINVDAQNLDTPIYKLWQFCSCDHSGQGFGRSSIKTYSQSKSSDDL